MPPPLFWRQTGRGGASANGFARRACAVPLCTAAVGAQEKSRHICGGIFERAVEGSALAELRQPQMPHAECQEISSFSA